jgi:hypothetical protein
MALKKVLLGEIVPDPEDDKTEKPAEYLLRLGQNLVNFIAFITRVKSEKLNTKLIIEFYDMMRKDILAELIPFDNQLFILSAVDANLSENFPEMRFVIVAELT